MACAAPIIAASTLDELLPFLDQPLHAGARLAAGLLAKLLENLLQALHLVLGLLHVLLEALFELRG